MAIDYLRMLYERGFSWVLVNKEDESDYRTFLCLPSAIREAEHLEKDGGEYIIIPTSTD